MLPSPLFAVRCRFVADKWLACGIVAAFVFAGAVRAEKLVTVRSVVDAGYRERRAATQPPKVETYVFAQGKYFSGGSQDSSLKKMPFLKIVQTLAVDLQQQNYRPAREIRSADLVIVVHWGATMTNDRGASSFAADPDSIRQAFETMNTARETQDADVTMVSSTLGTAEAAAAEFRNVASSLESLYQADDVRAASNAELLGFTAALNRENDTPFESNTAQTLRSMIDEERYFIIMVAYDGAQLREGKKHRVWTSRMSIRSAGVNFPIALDRMSNAGAKFHGLYQPELALERSKDRQGTVTIGDLKVISSSP